uniref:Gustatory receptor n=1 Tax=Diabrotica virgifera virgifera TaxID=50390 RepID=A0A6P7GRN1_DIAVI
MKSDAYFLNLIFNISCYVGVFPFRNRPILDKVLTVGMIILVIVGAIPLMHSFHSMVVKYNLGISEILGLGFHILSLLGFNGTCLYGIAHDKKLWELVFKTIDKLQHRQPVFVGSITYSCKLLRFFAIFLLVHFSLIWKTDRDIKMKMGIVYVLWIGAYFKILCVTVVIWHICNMLSARYVLITDLIRKSYEDPKNNFVLEKYICEIKCDIAYLNMAVKTFNIIAGKFVLALMCLTFLSFLVYFNFIFFVNNQRGQDYLVSISCMSESIVLSIFSTIIIFSCDRVGKRSEDFIGLCRYLEAAKGDVVAGSLANTAKGLKPRFTAAGFFNINQGVLTTFLCNLSTYLIIILQFKEPSID